MASRTTIFTTIRTEGALLPADLLQRISEGATIEGLTAESYHRPGEKLNEAINRSWNALQGAWASFKTAQERLPENDLGTTITRERWLLPLFRELDYGRLLTAQAVEIEGRSYPISHRWENVPIHLVSYKVDLDKRTARVAGASAASPHSLLQVFLNRSQDNLWGFLSNGYYLRILRDNATLTRQAYVEFDLQAMMEGEVYSDFVLLWLLGHQSRVEGERPADCWLEKWMKVAENEGTRALDDLRNGVEEAITALGLGFIEHPANHALRDQLTSGGLDKQDYYRQLLRLVYRLLFLFVAEDRDLLLNPRADETAKQRYIHYYSTQRLRRMAEKFKGTRHPDLYEGLRLVYRLLSGDQNGAGAGLGMVPLGSFLFSDGAVQHIIDCQISNQHLLTAIRALSLTYDQKAKVYRTVDYKNLGPEELGSIYESLLELHPQINVDARTFALATAGGNERKTTGSYYTPTSLINALLDSALDPVLKEAADQGEAAILNLKVCDPACGSGHFLIAAAGRMAKKLAEVRTGEEEPPPAAIQEAKRDIIGHCIYGVDINPMAVELCKVNLWMEALEPGKPLSFLDHRILCGNSLLGTTPRLMSEGIPDDAFQPIEGDDKKAAANLKAQNKKERKQREAGVFQQGLFDQPATDYHVLTEAVQTLDAIADDTLDGVRQKEAYYQQLASSPDYIHARLLADAWCAAFVWEKRLSDDGLPPMTDLLYRNLSEDPASPRFAAIRGYVRQLADQYQFFHWHVAFPHVFTVPDDPATIENEQTGWQGGFDAVIGNPPWDMVELVESEFFAARAPEIAEAGSARQRQQMILDLSTQNLSLYQEFLNSKRRIYGYRHFVQAGGRYPLASTGRINLYPLFVELSPVIISSRGRVGLIVPSAISSDAYNAPLFGWLISTHRMVSLFDFENRDGIFPQVHRSYRFCLLSLTDPSKPASNLEFAYFCHSVEDLNDKNRRIRLFPEEIRVFSPNTLAPPILQNQSDARLAKTAYKNLGVFVDEPLDTNLWQVSIQRMLSLSDPGDLFRTLEELNIENSNLASNDDWKRLYAGKVIHSYNHRFASFNNQEWKMSTIIQLSDPFFVAVTEYYARKSEVEKRLLDKNPNNWLLVYRDIARATDERTLISSIVPQVGCDTTCRNIYVFIDKFQPITCLISNMNSFILDYFARQKVLGTHINASILQQLPMIPPHNYSPDLLDFIAPRVLELTYTAWDLQPFAQDVGYDGPPFIWDEERRFLMRCELDALYFHLYQIARDDVDYIMETFPIVKRKDEAVFGEYATKRVILEMYDQMASLPKIAVPHPKGLDVEYLVPDVSQFTTWLNPPPADPSVAHPPREANE